MKLRRLSLCIMMMTLTGFCLLGVAYGQIDPFKASFGMIGIAYGQSAKLNVYVDSLDPGQLPPGPCQPDPTGALPPGPCTPGPWRVTFKILNGDGTVLAQSTQTLTLKQAASLDYRPTDIPFTPVRKRIRPIVLVDPDANGLTPCIKQTFELINDDTQRTAVLYPGQDDMMMGDMTQSAQRVAFGLVGVISSHIARLNVINTEDIAPPRDFPPGPCKVTLSFFGSDGSLLATITRTLDPGHAGSLDFNIASFGSGGGAGRLMIRAEVIVEPDANGLIPCVMPTLEVFDMASGKTTFIIPAS